MVGHIELVNGHWPLCIHLQQSPLSVYTVSGWSQFTGYPRGIHAVSSERCIGSCTTWERGKRSPHLGRDDIDIDILHIVHYVCEQPWAVCGLDNHLSVRSFRVL